MFFVIPIYQPIFHDLKVEVSAIQVGTLLQHLFSKFP